MLETGALSPEVKKLFAQIAKQADEYNKIFKRIEFATNEFEQDRNNMTEELAQIRDDIANSVRNLSLSQRNKFPASRDTVMTDQKEGVPFSCWQKEYFNKYYRRKE